MRIAPQELPDPELFCRQFQHHLGTQWASSIVSCYRRGAPRAADTPALHPHVVLYVWRDRHDELWAVDLLSRRIRSIDIAPLYTQWEIEPVDFWNLVRGSQN